MSKCETLQEAIRKARDVSGLSLQDVARRAGLSKPHIHDLESGRSKNPTVETLLKIARATGASYLALCQAAFNSLTELKP